MRLSEKRSKSGARAYQTARRLWRHGQDASLEIRHKALAKYVEAAESGVPEYQIALGQILCDEEDPEIADFKAGFNWILEAAKSGHRGAQYWAAVELATGENVRRNPAAAASWYRRAARRGSAAAQYNLGIMYWEGDGVRRNPQRGRQWIVRAAENGDMAARELLADTYRTGEMGFRPDAAKARCWRRRCRRPRR